MGKREYQREYYRKWYQDPDNAASKKANAKLHREGKRQRNQDHIDEYKRKHPCPCGESYIACLDFHHTNSERKERDVSLMVRDMCSTGRLAEEISKCIVLCRNCHAKLHFTERPEEPMPPGSSPTPHTD